MKTVWLLIFVYFHSAPIVPNLPSKEECDRLAKVLSDVRYSSGWSHECIPYQVSDDRTAK